jgi:hypothetical protein
MLMSAGEQIISASFCNEAKRKCCSSCGADFTCGPEFTEQSCWCEELPHVPLLAGADQDCLCPTCLGEAIATLSLSKNQAATPASGNVVMNSSPTLVEGTDYYCEGPAIVFTASYLLRRGYCCESGCRHCPYETAIRNGQPLSAPQ